MPARPQVLALALIRHPDGDRILATEAAGFQRLMGGKVELGELAHETVRRELVEELGIETTVAEQPRQVLQNIFEYEGELGHQISFVHDAAFVDERLYHRERFPRVDRPGTAAVWRPLAEPPDGVPLFPAGLDLSP